MSSTEATLAPRTPVEILKLTRTIFAASHWTTGVLQGHRWDEDLGKDKPTMCSVGGLRYAALAPMENALDGVWLAETLNLAEVSADSMAGSFFENYAVAIDTLAATASPERYSEFKSEVADGYYDHLDEWGITAHLEDLVIDWNDGFHYVSEDERVEVLEDDLLPIFDQAIATLATTTENNQEGTPS